MIDKKLIERFIEIVGVNHALVDQDVISSYLVEQRGLYHGRTPLVLRPSSPKEVSEIMKLASATGTPIVPQGGNTGLVGAQQPDESANEIIVSMERLNRIRSIDVEGNLALVEAGVVLQTLQ